MKQFAESICGIKKENNQNKYIITFDPTEKIQIKYDFCHHCKQRKPSEVINQCKSHLIGNKMCQRPIKTFSVNGTTVIRSKIYYFL